MNESHLLMSVVTEKQVRYLNHLLVKKQNQLQNLCISPESQERPLKICAGVLQHFPSGSRDKEPTCQCRRCKRCVFNTLVGKIPWRRAWQPWRIPASRIPGMEEPNVLCVIAPQGHKRVRHNQPTHCDPVDRELLSCHKMG